MKKITRVLMSILLGAAVCALLSAASFMLLALLDGGRADESFAYGLVVGLVGALAGALIGFAIGLGNWGPLGGGVVGLLATVAVVAVYVFAFGRPGEYGYFLRESGIFLVVLALPLAVTGCITAWRQQVRQRTGRDAA